MDIKSIIRKKRQKKELTKDEIKYFIGKLLKGEISEAQASAVMSYIYINGLTEEEILNLSVTMAESGDVIDLSDIAPNIVDKHSTGGIGDKATILLMPILASLDIPVAKVSSRGYGISGGTIDKLESIPGFQTDLSVEQFKQNLRNVGVCIMNQGLNFAPAEGKIYKLRNEVACENSLPIIASSLMSLKVATGSNKIVFDITSHEALEGEIPGTVVSQQQIEDEYIPNYSRVTVEMAMPKDSTDDISYGIFQEKLAEYPYPVPMKLVAVPSEGDSYTILSFVHPGGQVTITYSVPKGTTLVLYIVDKESSKQQIN